MKNEKDQVLFISSYPPRECGIATFTQDLVHAIGDTFGPSFDVKVCALEEEDNLKRIYPQEVVARLNTAHPEECIALAEQINSNDSMTSVVIEHEFGLFSGHYGKNLFYLLDEVRKPVFICFHTVLSHPEADLYETVVSISDKVEKIIVLTEHSKQVLQSDYHIDAAHITVIPHGIHLVKPITNKPALKAKYGFGDKILLGTFGLISSNKGIETALEAIAKMPDRSNILYLVMGKTHPVVARNEGEVYRDFLVQKTRELGIEENVLFINKYLELKELLTYLKLIDIYLFTSKDPKQTVSGTLSYAMGSGCTVLSTPIPHAKEMLSGGDAGFIFDFGNSDQLRDQLVELTGNPSKMKRFSLNAMSKAGRNSWENVAVKFSRLFAPHLKNGPQYKFPTLKLDHFCKLTTSRGMLQFANMNDPDRESGYTTDDNARALYVLTMYHELYPTDTLVPKYSEVFMNFLQRTLQANGKFLNYMNDCDGFTAQNDAENLEEANARAFLALSRYAQSPQAQEALKQKALDITKGFMQHIYSFSSPRCIAKIIKGLYYLDLQEKQAQNIVHIHNLSSKLMEMYRNVSTASWNWFEPYLTYNNSELPESLLYAYLATNESKYKKAAIGSFDFLLSKTFTNDGRICVVSNQGWCQKDTEYVHKFGEQPVEIAATIEGLHLFYQATGESKYKDAMHSAFSWFLGNNHLDRFIYNPSTGGCHDGLEEFDVNVNQGAESTLSYIVSRLTMEKLDHEENVMAAFLSLGEKKSIHK